MIEITSGDFLAGGGGVTEAMNNAGLKVKWVLNHDPIAIRTNMHNHKGVKHYLADFYNQDEHEMEPVDFVWASIECTQHSRANGGREKKIGSYTLGMELIRYIRFLNPLVIGIENVPEFKEWAPVKKQGTGIFIELHDAETGTVKTGEKTELIVDVTKKGEQFEIWKKTICNMGYDYHELICNAADYGIPTRRVRYFAFFTKKHLQMQVNWPAPTHSKSGENGLKKWVACRQYINLQNEGISIFGRELNPEVKPGKRKPLSENTMRRIAGGIKKYAPEIAFIFQYYGNGLNVQSLNAPLNTITTKDRHALVTLEKTQFIADYYGRDDTAHSLDGPANTITCENSKHLITFIADHVHSDNYNLIDEPLNPILTRQTKQFVSLQYNSGGKPELSNQSIDDPLRSITTSNKNQFITAFFNAETGEMPFDVDIKMRFLDPEELSRISTFPERYFTDPRLKLTKKEQTKLIGNAVPPRWAQLMIEPVNEELRQILEKQEAV